MRIEIKDATQIKKLQEMFNHSSPTKTINYMLETYEELLKQNNILSNQNMVLKHKLKC